MKLAAIFGGAVISLLAPQASANNPRNMPLAEQYPQADLVAVATLGPRRRCPVHDGTSLTGSHPCADLLIQLILKGEEVRPGVRRVLFLESGFAEMSVGHVPISGRALFFLQNSPNLPASRDEIFYDPVWGVDSILVIDDWPWDEARSNRR